MNKKVLKWNFIFQYGWVLTNIINSILLLPLYLKNIDKNTLGVWLATGNILGLMTLVDPGIGEVLQQKIAEYKGRQAYSDIGKSIGSGMMASAVILAISVVVGFGFYFSIGLMINKDVHAYPHLAAALMISVVATAMTLVSFSVSGINQGLHNAAPVAVSSLSANFLFLFSNLLGLYAGLGVLSIALANLVRAVYINIFNLVTLFSSMKTAGIRILYEMMHFKVFIRIFSFTSASKIITGLSSSIEMIVLARYISPSWITLYEINKRPINITSSLVGRHSVALMPSISHLKGSGDNGAITRLIGTQARIYVYAILFTALVFWFNYANLITAWTGEGQFIGTTILSLLVAAYVVNLLVYFMSTIGYALGDIKMNSLYNIIRNIVFGILMFFAARYFGIVGTVSLTLITALTGDMIFFAYRMNKLGFLNLALVKDTFRPWLLIAPLAIGFGWLFRLMISALLPASMHFALLIINAGMFSLFFLLLVMLFDHKIRLSTKQLAKQYVVPKLNKLRRA